MKKWANPICVLYFLQSLACINSMYCFKKKKKNLSTYQYQNYFIHKMVNIYI